MKKKKQKIDTKIVLAAIAALVVLEAIALFNGINGTMLRFVVIAIALLGGLVLPTPQILRRE